MPVSDPDVSRPRLVRDATFLEADRREIALRRGSHNRLGFAYQVAFVRVLGRFPQQAPLEIDGEILRFAALQLSADAETIHAYARRQQTVSAHQRRIGQYLRLRTFDTAAGEQLARFLEDEALRLDRTGSLLARAWGWLRDEHVLAPADSALRRAVGGARQKARALLTQRMAERLSASMRDRLDALVAVGDDDPHSPLHRIKTGSSSPSVGGMKRLLARLELIEATGVLEVDIGWVNGNYQRILFHSVRTASADRVREMAAPRRHLALVCFLHQAWRDTLDQAVDMYGKLLDRNRKLVEARLDDMLKAQRQAVDRIVHRYRQLGAVLLDPDVGDDELRARLLSTVPEAQLREDQSDLANWTRGDRKARFEQTAERHAGLSQFAGPFLSRMKFVDEQGEEASPTLSALRAYREHRAAGRRGVPPDAPLDFAPAALQPLIRHDGVTDRRRWESALFLKVRDEIQTGNQRAALAAIVHGISRLDAAGHWGDGTTSASDGQRFAMPQKVLQRTYSTRFNDFALEFYSFVADNYAPFYSRPIECTDRDAPFVLDGVLYHESDLDLEEHYTDTHGYTEINFAAFGMVGMRFCPRIRSLHRQRIYCADQGRDHGVLEPVLKRGRRAVNFRLIAAQWDRIGQFYAAFPAGHATASAALQRLNRFQASNRFYAANRELGRALKTEFVLQYMSEPQLRAKVRRGLLKVEQLHALARAVYYGQRGRISAREVYDQVNACSCLTLILACIVYWQAREISRMAAAPDFPFDPDLLRHVSPIEWKNVVLYGEIKIDPAKLKMRGP